MQGKKLKSKVFKAISSGLALVIAASMLVGVSPVSAATNNLWAWGFNSWGQLGYPLILYATEPVQVSGLSDVNSVAGGNVFSLALTKDGTVWGWGNDTTGQLGDGQSPGPTNQSTPVRAVGLTKITAICAGRVHTIVLMQDGTVWGMGGNGSGNLGDGTTTGRTTPVQVKGLTGVIAIAAGFQFSMALKSDGTVWTWGSNADGQIGDGTKTDRSTPVQVSGLTGVKAIAAGYSHSLALKSDGTVWTWGNNSNGQLGDGTTVQRLTPVPVNGLTGITAIASGYYHSLALKPDGTVWVWGQNSNGQLGDGTTVDRLTPVQVSGLTGVTTVSAGGSHSLALKPDGTVWAWGSNDSGQLGTGNTAERHIPVQVSGLSGVVAIGAGYAHNLAAKSDGTVWGWGINNFSQLGYLIPVGCPNPLKVGGINSVVAVDGGLYFGLALKSDGTAWGWGQNDRGQLGTGTVKDSIPTPVQVSGLTNLVDISTGIMHGLAAKSDGTVWAWGQNNAGQLGDGSTTNRLAPVQVSGLTGIVAVKGIAYFSLALKSDGTVWGWGQNDKGQLGDGSTTDGHTPVQVSGMTNVIAIGAGARHGLALKSDGTVWTWGQNNYGQLGDGTTTEKHTPVQVSGLTGIVAIAGGTYYSLALKSDGTVWAWGYNNIGQLGDGTTSDRHSPTQVSRITGVIAIDAGVTHSLALKSDGTMWAWGDNAYGQLSNIAAQNSTTPVQVNGLNGIAAIGTGSSFSFAIESPDAPSTAGAVPADEATNVQTNTAFNWVAVPFVSHDFQLSTRADFTTLTVNISNSSNNTYTPTAELSGNTTYFWRVRSRLGKLTSPWTTARFTTEPPFTTAPAPLLSPVPTGQKTAQAPASPALWIFVFVAAGVLFVSTLFVIKVRTGKTKLAVSAPNEIPLSAGKAVSSSNNEIRNESNNQPKGSKTSIRINCFGEFKVLSDSGQISLWRNKPAKLTFEYLVVKHGNPVIKDSLMEVLWPGGSPDSSANNLKTVMYQVRDTLKPLFGSGRTNPVLFKEGRYLLNPEIDIIVDFIEFERHWKQGKQFEKEGNSGEARIEYEKAASMYSGDFMEEELYQEWTIPYRESLKDIYLLLTDKLSEMALLSDDYITCIEYCHKILAKDECREDVYRKLMKCYNRLGQDNNALKWYDKCRLTIKTELGTQPGSETESLRKRILAGEKI